MNLTIFKKGLLLICVPFLFHLFFLGWLLYRQQTTATPGSENQTQSTLPTIISVFFAGAALSLAAALGLSMKFSSGLSGSLPDLGANGGRPVNDDLENRVRDRTEELNQANRELAHKNQEIETFVYSVSHDLRSPLVNLEGFSKELDLVYKELRPLIAKLPPDEHKRALQLLDKDMAESLGFIRTAVRRLSGIIDALLRLSRVGRVELQYQEVDVQAVVRRVVDALHGTISQRGAEVHVGALPAISADPTALEQIFANLIGNALNYLDPARPGRIEVGVRPSAPSDKSQLFFVKDNGLGIARDYQHKVFQAFQRLHPDRVPGEGMGLAIVRRIVERLHGKIWIESEVGQGSTFFFNLPTGQAQQSSPKTQTGSLLSWDGVVSKERPSVAVAGQTLGAPAANG